MTTSAAKSSSKYSNDQDSVGSFLRHRLREGGLIVALAFAAFLLLALITYHRNDPSWLHSVNTHEIANAGGRFGAWIADFLFYLFGFVAYCLPFLLAYSTWLLYKNRFLVIEDNNLRLTLLGLRWLGFILTLLTATALVNLFVTLHNSSFTFYSGGVLGNSVAAMMQREFNEVGGTLLLASLLLVGITLLTELSWVRLCERIGAGVIVLSRSLALGLYAIPWKKLFSMSLSAIRWGSKKNKQNDSRTNPEVHTGPIIEVPAKPQTLASNKKARKRLERAFAEDPEPISKNMKHAPRYKSSNVLPKLALLDELDVSNNCSLSKAELEQRSRDVESHLADFGVAVKVVAVFPGPVVTRFELQLAAGTKVSKITGLAKDLARSLSVVSVRVVEVIPGKSVIGVELPNTNREMVSLKEVLASKAYTQARSALSLGLGKDIAGHSVVVDLAKMPHLLVAGTTGSGKSVSLNAMLLSLLYKATPQQLRMIMIDPKMLELSVYDGIPHLLTPVVTDMKDAACALRWCVAEMERRYRLMAALGVRNIAGYNAKVKEAIATGAPLLDPLHTAEDEQEQKALQILPQIVVLADEFADMMVVVGKKVETLIARLAQKARAAGVHLILATQRPSVDVITGLIKANIPTRIAFQVSSKIDSRTILDQQGAEQLLGHGDMLYLPPGSGVPMRVHGAYVSDDEVHRVVASLKRQAKPDYIEGILDEANAVDTSGYTDAAIGESGDNGGDAEQDALYDEAVHMVTKARRVSVSSVQRRFKIGYNRAARIVEAMEKAGVVSAMEGNGVRQVLAPPPHD